MENFTGHEENAAALAVGVIRELVSVSAVWCFGVRSKSDGCTGSFFVGVKKCERVHLYLLAFADGLGDGCEALVAEAIAKKSDGLVTATVLFYENARLSRVKGNHRCFLGAIVSGSRCLYHKKGYAIPEFVTLNPDESAKIDYWNHCRYMAICCLEAETAIENPNADPVQAALLHQAVEQLCLGLIYVFLGCRPNYYGLGYLLELCALFMPEVEGFFPRGSAEEQARFAVLSLRMESLRYRAAHPSITDIEVLRSRTHKFLAGGELAVEGRFNRNKPVTVSEGI